MAENALAGLNYVVQYKRKDSVAGWRPMAAFDTLGPSQRYAAQCEKTGSEFWDYRAVELPEAADAR